ncbi:MAG: DUF4159 domain-containing protein [Phycisphaerae bacterium]
MPRTLLTILVVLAITATLYPAPPDASEFSHEKVEQSIEKAKQWLYSQQKNDGSWGDYKASTGAYPSGLTSIVLFALLESGENAQDPRLEEALEWLTIQSSDKTYSLGLRCNVWELANRQTGGQYEALLKQDVELLVKSTKDGSYDYDCHGSGQSSGDNSNSQYGVLGAWAGAKGDLEVPTEYWQMVQDYWVGARNKDGGWGYKRDDGKSTGTMTSAGIASLYVAIDNLHMERFIRCGAGVTPKPIEEAVDWLDRHFIESIGEKGHKGKHLGWGDLYYHLFGVERVGLAGGYKYFGEHDWYKLGAVRLLDEQRSDGSWKGKWDPLVSTSYALLFLSRGEKPVLFNKLRFEGDWNNRPRDLAALTRWLGETFETDMYWQIVNLQAPVSEWHDAPMLYISGSRSPEFSPSDIDKLRRYVQQGGVIFSTTECNARAFTSGIRRVYKQMFPEYSLEGCKPDHDLYSTHFQLRGKPRFFVLSNGVRPLVIHCDQDLPVAWQVRRYATQRWAFEGAANAAMYVSDMGSFRPRGVSHWPDEPGDFQPRRTVKLARIKFDGNSDPEPLAYQRFARMMAEEHRVRVEVGKPAAASDLPDSDAEVATLTGTGSFELSDADADALKQWVADGGTLLIDAAGGDAEFADSAEKLIDRLYGPGALRRLSSRSDIYTLEGMEIEKVRYRRQTRSRLGDTDTPNLRAVTVDDRPAVIFSPEDITGGLLGVPACTIDGYTSDSAWELVRNIVLSATGGAM